jgi:hypothetical protein
MGDELSPTVKLEADPVWAPVIRRIFKPARVEVYTRSGDALLLRAYAPDDTARIDAIAASIPVRALYEGISLDPVEPPERAAAPPPA